MTRALDPDTEIDEITPARARKSGRWKRVLSGTTPWTPAEAAAFGQPLGGGKRRKLGMRVLVGTTRGTLRGVVKAGSAGGRVTAHGWRTYRQRVRFDAKYEAEAGEVPVKIRRPRRTGDSWLKLTLGQPKHRCITCGRAYDCPEAFRRHADQHLIAELPAATSGNAWAHLAEGGFTGTRPVPSWKDALRIRWRSRKFKQEIGRATGNGQRPKLVLVKGTSRHNPAAVPVNRGVTMFDTWEHTPYTHTLQVAAGHLTEQPLKMTVINASARGTEWGAARMAEAWRAWHLKLARGGFDLASIQWMLQIAASYEQMAQVASRGIAQLLESYGPAIAAAVAEVQGRKPDAKVLAS